MRAPSTRSLIETFRLSKSDADLIRHLAKATDNPQDLEALIALRCPKTESYVRKLYSSPYHSHMWRVTVALHAMDVILDTNGVEAIPDESGGAPQYEYLNTGDPYSTTLIYNRKTDSLKIGSWGDIAEKFSAAE